MFNNTNPNHGTILFVKHPIRKDGRFACTFLYQSNGRRIGKLLTQTQIDVESARGNQVIPKGVRPRFNFNSQTT